MRNKKKRTDETALKSVHSSCLSVESGSSGIAMVASECQLVHPIEVKQESQIKEELQPVVDLVDIEVSMWNSDVVVAALCVDQPNEAFNFDSFNRDGIKVEVKEEVDKKVENEAKANVDSVDVNVTGNHHGHQSVSQQLDDDSLLPTTSHGPQNPRRGDPKNMPKKHKCNHCEYSTNRSDVLEMHFLKHTAVKPHGCNFCLKNFKHKRSLRLHIKMHVNEFLFHCAVCLEGFDRKEEKVEHEVNCNVRRYQCHLCTSSFGSMKIDLLRHMRIHTGETPFKCEECFKQFKHKGNLTEHLKIHAGPRPFSCSKCCLRFINQGGRNAHEENCNRRIFECFVCGKKYGVKKSNLVRHMRRHSEEFPFECQHCLKRFTRRLNLNRHIQSHTKNFPFK